MNSKMTRELSTQDLSQQFSLDADGNIVINSSEFKQFVESAPQHVEADKNKSTNWD